MAFSAFSFCSIEFPFSSARVYAHSSITMRKVSLRIAFSCNQMVHVRNLNDARAHFSNIRLVSRAPSIKTSKGKKNRISSTILSA